MVAKTLLFIGGAKETVSALGQAWAHGYDIIVVDGNENSPGMQWARKNGLASLQASTYDGEAILKAIGKITINGVLAVACDVGPVVSQVATYFGLPCIPYTISRMSWDKRELKAFLNGRTCNSVPMPLTPNDLIPPEYMVIKPVDGRGSRGVYRLPFNISREQEEYYTEKARNESPSRKLLTECWIDGPQVSTESIVYQNEVVFTGMTDRFYHYLEELAPYVIENGGVGPSMYENTPIATKIRQTIQKAVNQLAIVNGTIKCDFVLDIKKNLLPTLIECAIGRLSGGYMCSHYIPLAYGVDFLGAAFALAGGNDPRSYLKQLNPTRYVCGMYEMPETAENMTHRGRFHMAIGTERKDTILRAIGMTNERCIDRIDRTMLVGKVS